MKKNTPLNILLIGGTGVLSRAIAQYAIDAGHNLTMLTNGEGIFSAPEGVVKHLIADRNNEQEFTGTIKKHSPKTWDLVIDAICYHAHHAQYLLSVIEGKSLHTIVISSHLLYQPSQSLINETSLLMPVSKHLGEYEKGKLAMEKVWLKAYQENNHPVSILRVPHILGKGSQLGIIPMHNRDLWLIKRLLDNKPLFLVDNGQQILQTVFNEDVAEIIFRLHGNNTAWGKIYNCANPETFSAYDYFAHIAKLLHVKLKVLNIPKKMLIDAKWGWETTLQPRVIDMSLLANTISQLPKTSYKQAISVTLEYLIKNIPPVDETYLCFDDLEDALLNEKDINTLTKSQLNQYKQLIFATAQKRKRLPIDSRMTAHIKLNS